MKTMKTKKKPILLFLTLIGLICVSAYVISCTGLQAHNRVNDAYELRINGQADSAVALLNDIILDEPDNALAYYELARTQQHMMLAGGGYEISDIIENASKAGDLDPDNLSYAYFEAHSIFLDAYIDIMRGQEEIQEKLDLSFSSFERILEIQPCYPSVLITLTEINSMLPPDFGGDPLMAEKYAGILEDCDPIQALKAKAFLLPEDGDLLAYWTEIYDTHEANAVISEELGRAYLLEGDIENGKKYFDEALLLDPGRSILLIDLGRACMMASMQSQDKELGDKALLALQQYLDNNPDAPGPMQAYVYRTMGLICKRITDDDILAEEYMTKQMELDPFCSQAFGAPAAGLFSPPDELPPDGGYYSRPF